MLWAVAASSAGASEPPRYDIRARVDAAQKKVEASQTVVFTNPGPGDADALYFQIHANRRYTKKEQDFVFRYGGYFKINPYPENFQQSRLEIRSVTSGSRALPFAVEGKDETLLKVTLDRRLSPGQSVTVQLDYDLTLPHAYGRFGWHEQIIKLSRWYPILSVYNGKGWNNYPFYPFHRPFFSEASLYNVELTVPADQTAAHTGVAGSSRENGDGTKTISLSTPQPVREFTIAMSPQYDVVEEEWEGIKIKVYYLPGRRFAAGKALSYAKSMMAFYTKKFGQYPYPEFSVAPVHLGYGGEQMSNLVFIDTRAFEMPGFLDRYFDFLVSHETGHQWFYNLVGINEYTEMWLEEGINSYFVLEYLESKYGRNASVLEYPAWFSDWAWTVPELTFRRTRDVRYKMITRTGYDHAVVSDLASFSEPSSIFSLTYGKGAGIAAMLKGVVGEEAFDRIFQRVFKEYAFKNLSIEEFIRISQEESRRDLGWFFQPWLYSDEKLDYAIAKVDGKEITIREKGGIRMPLQMQVDFRDGTQKIYDVDMQGKNEVIVLEDKKPVKRLQLDPKDKLLDIDRTNDHWPRKFHLRPVPLYLGLYEIPALMPEDSYNIVVGPEISNGLGLKASFQKPFDYIAYAGTDYEFGEQLHHSRVGYRLNNIFESQTSAGVEISNTKDYENGQDDLASGKVYLRRELWPAPYNVADLNDHVSLYLLRNRNINDGADIISGREDGRNIDYSRRNESIAGVALHLDRSGPSPEPVRGYKLDVFAENAGHFWGATQYFFREAADVSVYQAVTPRSRLAGRLKAGAGHPDDKALFYLGGMDGLRGYELKSVRGANALLGSVEYRFPVKDNLKLHFFDNLIGIESIGGVVFADAGQSWFSEFKNSSLKRDAGVGLRMTVNFGSLLEKAVIRADVAQAISDDDEDDPRFWFGVNHSF